MSSEKTINRRELVVKGASLAAMSTLPLGLTACFENTVATAPEGAVVAAKEVVAKPTSGGMMTRAIPGTDEYLPVVGLGAPKPFITTPPEGNGLAKTLIKTMMENGGRVIDTPPFFRSGDPVLGKVLGEMGVTDDLFLTGKITVSGKQEGFDRLERISRYLNKMPMDVLMIHNMRDLKTHWPTLKQWKEEGKVRYIGVSRTRTTDFTELEAFMKNERPDFLLIGYSITQQGPAERVLPLAADIGTAVIGAEAFKASDDGAFFKIVSGKPLPEWAAEFDCESWAQFSLKWILSNPAMTTVVTETSKAKHVLDNMRGGYGGLPDETMRKRMSEYLLSLGA